MKTSVGFYVSILMGSAFIFGFTLSAILGFMTKEFLIIFAIVILMMYLFMRCIEEDSKLNIKEKKK